MRRLQALVAVILLACTQGMAQPVVTVTGRVTDEKGAAIAGATITEKGTRNASTTADNGSWSIRVKPKALLVISYVGYVSAEISAKEGLVISLNPDTKSLSDVVVTGVGVATSKKKVPIDVATVSARDFAPSATTSIEQALDGQIAGAHIQQTSGTPGAPFNITLRGINSLDGTNPLIMVDGVQMNDLTALDPANVDHIEVVKGAAGGMLYGAQGANGVIQVFTKKGILNTRPAVTFNSKVSVDNILKGKHPLMTTHHYFITDASNNITDQNGIPIAMDATGQWSNPQTPNLAANPDLETSKTYNIPIYNHIKQSYQQALTFNNSVSVTGGGNSTDYALTGTQLNQQDVFGNSFSRSNISLNLGIQPFKGFTIRSISQAIIGYDNLLNNDRFSVLLSYPFVNFKWKDSTGHFPFKTNAASNALNPLSENQWHKQDFQRLQLFQDFDFNYKFPRFVELDIKYGLDYTNVNGTDYFMNQSAAVQTDAFWGPDRLGNLLKNFTNTFQQNGLFSAFFRTDFEKDFHSNLPIHTTTQFAYDYRKDVETQYYTQGTQLPIYPPATINSANIKSTGEGNGELGNAQQDLNQSVITFGFLINQTIDYGNLFGISGGVRSDYGSAFGAAYKPFTFPRGTVYFRPSELLKNTSWLTDWKVRAAYGEAGIQPMAYDRQTTLTQTTLGSGSALSLANQATNDTLRLAVSKELEVGTDFTVAPFQGDWLHRITVSGTYWHRTTSDIYQQANVAPSTGYASRLNNLSTISSNGVDLSLDATVFSSSNIIWNLATRWGFARSIVTKIANGQDIINGEFAVKQGKELGLFYGQTPLHSISQLMADGKTPYIPAAQQQYYVVASSGYVVDTRTNAPFLTASNDLSVLGHAYPNFTSSLINSVTLFKTLTISFQFDWVHGNSIYNLTKQWLYTPAGGAGGSGANSVDYDKNVTIGSKTGNYVNYYQTLYNLVKPTSTFVENGSYIRLRDLSVSYDLTNLIHTNAIKRLTITASGRNLLTFTKYDGLDPENTGAYDTQGNDLSKSRTGAFSGVDYFGSPNLRSYMFSLHVGF